MKIHSLNGYINTLFIAEYEDYLLLLDGGSPADVDLIEKFCIEELNRPVSNIKLAIVSHMHPDHSGAAPILRKKYGTRIAAYKNIDEWYSGPTGWFQHKLDCLMAQIVAVKHKTKIRKVFSKRITGPDYLMSDMEPLPFFNDWRVIYTPGHTSHDIAVFNEEEKILYCGDSIIEVRGRVYLPLPVIFRKKNETLLQEDGGAWSGTDTYSARQLHRFSRQRGDLCKDGKTSGGAAEQDKAQGSLFFNLVT